MKLPSSLQCRLLVLTFLDDILVFWASVQSVPDRIKIVTAGHLGTAGRKEL